MNQKVVAIHQPNYMPWVGYFIKMALSDTFVFHDDVEYSKNTATRRVKIPVFKELEASKWITVPLKKHSDFSKINQLLLADDFDWRRDHMQHLQANYHQYPFFKKYFGRILSWYDESRVIHSLSKLNIFFIEKLRAHFDILADFRCSSEMNLQSRATDANRDIVMSMRGTHYVFGMGASHYQEDFKFMEKGINILKLDSKKVGAQLFPEVKQEIGLSALGLIFAYEEEELVARFSKLKGNAEDFCRY